MPRDRNFAGAGTLLALSGVLIALLAGPIPQARAQTIVDKWASMSLPPPPALKALTVDPKTTALLMLDFMSQNCGKRPACVASLPTMKKLLAEARAAKATIVYSIIAHTTTADVMPDVAPLAGEPWVQAGPDKFLNTELAKILKDKGIQTVIVTGTASNGAVLFTAAGAAFRGMNVIVPVDGMSAADPFADLSTAYTVLNAPSLSAKSTLTKADMIKF
jgi:nicotinamidase-related amidase